MSAKRKYYFKHDLTHMAHKEHMNFLNKEVFETEEFNKDIEQVAQNMKINKEIVRDVVVSYFYNIFKVINTVRKIKTKINIYGYFSLLVEKGSRI